MMDELKDVKRVLNPTEVLLVVDAMTGQEAAGTSTLIKHANDLLHATDSSLLVKYGF